MLCHYPKRSPLNFMLAAILLAGAAPIQNATAAATNFALGKTVTASSTYQAYYPSNAVDGVVSDASRWLGSPSAAGNWIAIDLGATVTLRQAHVYLGYQTQAGSWITNLQFQAWSGSTWTNVPGGAATNLNSFAVVLTFAAPLATDRVRLFTSDTTFARLREITLWGEPTPLYTGVTGEYVPGAPSFGAPILVNQIGYQVGAPKRFTAPTVPDGTPYSITLTNSTNGVFSGSIAGAHADFSTFEPADPGPYVIRITGETNGTSYPFLILSNLIQAKYTVPAAQFMVDSRSGVGTHHSAFGGCPWRDGTYYSFEIPSLIYLLLNDRATIETMPREINYGAEKAMVLATNFNFITTTEDSGFLDALRRYYANQPPPLATATPDLVQCIHFGLGVTLERPATRDWSGDERPRQVHSQTVEWCAYFLHAWPVLRDWLDDAFYRNVRDFTFAQWTVSSGLGDGSPGNDDPSSLEIDPLWSPSTYGTVDKHPYKGRHAPAHSILPNLLMYEVAQREGRTDAGIYLNAARTQAQWVIDNLDWADPRTTKGHRMSEHKMMPGLVYFLEKFPNHAPPGLAAKVRSWAETVLARSENLWDFRMYETNDFDGDGLVDWSLPKFSQNWNEPGNLAGFPACALAAKTVVTDPGKRQRLTEVSWAAIDCLFGRNPLNATSASRIALGFADAENGWTPLYTGAAAYLELCRGALASGPATEHFPYNPSGPKRHHEGWVNFNAAWNVSLAYMLADLKSNRDTLRAPLPIVISEILPAPAGDPLAEYIELHNPTPYPARLSGVTLDGSVQYQFTTNALMQLTPGARCLIVRDPSAFTNRFGTSLPVSGTFTGDLPDSGGTLTLGDVNGNTFTSVDLGALKVEPGHSLVFGGDEGGAGPWTQSTVPGGSPGTTGPSAPLNAFVLREGVNGFTHTGALIRGDNVDLNSGARDQLIVGRNASALRSVLSFPLAAIPTNAIVKGVTLDLWTAPEPGSGTVGVLELRALDATPLEGFGDGSGNGAGSGVTWVSRTGAAGFGESWISKGGDFSLPLLSSVPGYSGLLVNTPVGLESSPDFVNAAQAAVSAGKPLDLLLCSPATEAGANAWARFSSDDSPDVSHRPRLTLTYVTEPGPFALHARPDSWSEVSLAWRENLADETGFLVERMTGSNGVWSPVITTRPNVTMARDCGLSADMTYAYRVRGFFSDGSGSDDATAVVRTAVANARPPIRLMPLGDSITQGSGVPGGYRDPLHTLLTNAGFEVLFVGSSSNNSTATLDAAGNAGHEGHGGYMTTDLLANLDAAAAGPSANNGGSWLTGLPGVRPPVNPDVILLMAGVNDLGVNQLPPEQGLAGLDKLLSRLTFLRPSAWIIVSALPPYIGTNYPNREANQAEFNAALPALIDAHRASGCRVALCDVRSRLNLTNAAALLSADGVHPNAAGYLEIARVWFAAFQQLPLIENWRQSYFGSPSGVNDAADAADWDGDGLLNGAEFFYGTNPTNPTVVSPFFTDLREEGVTNFLSVRFPRRKHSDLGTVADVAPQLQAGASWSPQILQVGPPVTLGTEFEQVTFRDTVSVQSAPSRFLRLGLATP